MNAVLTYKLAETDGAFACARELFTEYAQSLPIDLSFQDFDRELATLSRQYHAPSGALLLAYCEGLPAGCVGVRELGLGTAELKRLYVRPAYRGLHLGKALLEQALAAAKTLGYHTIRLDTLPGMYAAQRLYRSVGFVSITPYRFNPAEGAVYLEKNLN